MNFVENVKHVRYGAEKHVLMNRIINYCNELDFALLQSSEEEDDQMSR